MCIHSKLKSSRWYQKCLHTFFEITTTDNFLGKNNVLRKRCFQKLGSQCASVTGWRPPKQRHKKRPFMQKPSPRSHHADALLQVDIPCSCYSSLLAILGSLPAHSKIVQGLESVRIVCEPATIPCLSFSMNSMPPHSKIVQELGIVCEPATICLSF